MATSSPISSRQARFGTVPIIITIGLILLVAILASVVYNRNGATKSATATEMPNPPVQQPIASLAQQEAEKKHYEGLTQYSNAKYSGLSFYYPSEWRVEEADVSATTLDYEKIEFSLHIRATTSESRSEIAVLSVSTKGLETVVADFGGDKDHGASKFKTMESLKGRSTAKFVIPQGGGVNRIIYYFPVGDKTYSLATINEDSNLKRLPEYYATFNKLVDSLRLP